MPWKQNRYLILTKPRPHKRIFSGSRFCNESRSRSRPPSPLVVLVSLFSPVLSQGSALRLCVWRLRRETWTRRREPRGKDEGRASCETSTSLLSLTVQ